MDEQSDIYIEEINIQADKGQEPMRIDKFLMNRIENASRNKIQNAIKAGAVLVNDLQIKSNYKVKPFDEIKIIREKEMDPSEGVKAENLPLEIVYEDDQVMVINKATGMVVHPGFGNKTGTLVNAIAYHLENKPLPHLPGNNLDRPGLVHRLDKDTTGLMVIAKTDEAITHLAKQFFDRTVKRNYTALVWGNFDNDEGGVEGNIGRSLRNRLIMSVFKDEELGKYAKTNYKVLEDLYYVSIIQCTLETGRTHQIRCHMQYIKHPVFGDELYGGKKIVKGTVFSKYKKFVENCFELCPRQALHASTIGFVHPRSGKFMQFESELPNDMKSVIDKWRAYANSVKYK